MKYTDKTKGLLAALQETDTILIVLQDNPDPDAIASAAALRCLANLTADAQCSIASGGTVGRAENRAMVDYLDMNLRDLGELDPARFELIAMVDTQPGTGNNSLPVDALPDIVIDHHPINRLTRSCPFIDIRSRYGATSTMMHEHLRAAGIEISTPLATALLYGIRSDTQDLGRETIQADIDAFLALYPKANKRVLSRIERGQVPTVYFRMLNDALDSSRIYDKCIVTSLGEIDNPDMIGEMADLFLRHEQCSWTMCYGFRQSRLLLSVRTSEPDADAGRVARRIVGRKGCGGGHGAMAAGWIPLKGTTASERNRISRTIVKRFLRAIGTPDATGRKLIP